MSPIEIEIEIVIVIVIELSSAVVVDFDLDCPNFGIAISRERNSNAITLLFGVAKICLHSKTAIYRISGFDWQGILRPVLAASKLTIQC